MQAIFRLIKRKDEWNDQVGAEPYVSCTGTNQAASTEVAGSERLLLGKHNASPAARALRCLKADRFGGGTKLLFVQLAHLNGAIANFLDARNFTACPTAICLPDDVKRNGGTAVLARYAQRAGTHDGPRPLGSMLRSFKQRERRAGFH